MIMSYILATFSSVSPISGGLLVWGRVGGGFFFTSRGVPCVFCVSAARAGGLPRCRSTGGPLVLRLSHSGYPTSPCPAAVVQPCVTSFVCETSTAQPLPIPRENGSHLPLGLGVEIGTSSTFSGACSAPFAFMRKHDSAENAHDNGPLQPRTFAVVPWAATVR